MEKSSIRSRQYNKASFRKINLSLSRITVLYNAVRLALLAMPLQIIVADHRLPMRQDSIVLAREGARRSPNIGQIALDLHAFILRDELPTAAHDNLEFQHAHVLDRVVFLADDLPDEGVRAAWEDEVVLLAEQRLHFVELLRYWLVIARCQRGCFN